MKNSQINLGIIKKSLRKKFHNQDRSIPIITNHSVISFDINNFYLPVINQLVSDFINFGSHMYSMMYIRFTKPFNWGKGMVH